MNTYDLEKRTLEFSKEIRFFVKNFKQTMLFEDIKQVIRSSGSIGANYIEANESLSKKDFIMRIKISRKEAKETIYWLEIIKSQIDSKEKINKLIVECIELKKILSSILNKTST